MRASEAGFLLLGSHLGNPNRRTLTTAQIRTLAQRAEHMSVPEEQRDLEAGDLLALGFGREAAERILSLLGEEALLKRYLQRGKQARCTPITWGQEAYPAALRRKLGQEAPVCLWAKGNLALLNTPMVSLAGSRDILPPNKEFAREVGIQAAAQGYTLVSGNARGADGIAQNACLEAGGRVVSVIADGLEDKTGGSCILYVSEEDFDAEFSAPRALHRNRLIHALGRAAFIAQCANGTGGTWAGTEQNLRRHLSPVFGFRDGSDGMKRLEQMGAVLIEKTMLSDFSALDGGEISLWEQPTVPDLHPGKKA